MRAAGSRPASSQATTAAAIGIATRISSKLFTGTVLINADSPPFRVFDRTNATSPRYAAKVPSTAPKNPSAPAVAAVIVRRVHPLAPVAVSVRRSPAVSLRMRPMLIARIASASTIPNTVARSMTSYPGGALDFVSMLIPETSAAMKRALRICAAVGGWFVTMNQPASEVCRWSVRIACSVITVFGADVPEGSEPTYWIFGFQMHELFGHGYGLEPFGGPPPPRFPTSTASSTNRLFRAATSRCRRPGRPSTS